MSGGSYDYFYFKVDTFRYEMRLNEDPRRFAVKRILDALSKVAHAIEWEDSGDTSKENTDKNIDELLSLFKSNPDSIVKALAYDEFKKIVKNYLDIQ